MKIPSLLVGCILFALLGSPSLISQQQPTDSGTSTVPRLMKFSGVVTKAGVGPQTGVAGVTFSLYKAQEGGAPLWMETQNVKLDPAGHYTAFIGVSKADGLPMDLFASGEARWLGVQVEGQPEQPRVLLLSVPYALKASDAETLGGKPASAYTLAPTADNGAPPSKTAGRTATTKNASAAVTPAIAGTGTTGYFARWTSSTNLGNSLLYQTTGGLIGLGTTAPTQKFQVNAGNLLVKGPANFVSAGNLARVFVGDTNHAVTARYSGGLSLDTYLVPNAIFVQDTTGRVGIGATASLTGMLNVIAKSSSVTGLNVTGFTGTTSTDGIRARGGNNTTTGGTGSAGLTGTGGNGTIGGPGLVGNGGQAGAPYKQAGTGVIGMGGPYTGLNVAGDGVHGIGAGGSLAGWGVIGDGGDSSYSGGIGVIGTGGESFTQGSGGPGLEGIGGPSSTGFMNGDGILASPGSGDGSPGYAGSFSGDVNVTGTLYAGTKNFRIDHPLDPANKYLLHASVESAEMLDVYSGNTILDGKGQAVVHMPQWFETVNTDFRYQLTAVGAPSPGLYIAKEISNHQFTIAGGAPGSKVSWQISAVRHDPYARANPLVVEQIKNPRERGYYIHPQLYGAPEERGIQWARYPEIMRRAKELRKAKLRELRARAGVK